MTGESSELNSYGGALGRLDPFAPILAGGGKGRLLFFACVSGFPVAVERLVGVS